MGRIVAIALLLAALPAPAEVYKWVDRDGKVHYGDTPPTDARSRQLEVRNPVVIENPEQPAQAPSAPSPPDRHQAAAVPEPAPAPPPPAVRGMAFGTYIELRLGMSEGELLTRAGAPDYRSDDGSVGVGVVQRGRRIGQPGKPGTTVHSFNNLELRNYYYYPTLSDPFTTVVTLTGGHISDIKRTRKF